MRRRGPHIETWWIHNLRIRRIRIHLQHKRCCHRPSLSACEHNSHTHTDTRTHSHPWILWVEIKLFECNCKRFFFHQLNWAGTERAVAEPFEHSHYTLTWVSVFSSCVFHQRCCSVVSVRFVKPLWQMQFYNISCNILIRVQLHSVSVLFGSVQCKQFDGTVVDCGYACFATVPNDKFISANCYCGARRWLRTDALRVELCANIVDRSKWFYFECALFWRKCAQLVFLFCIYFDCCCCCDFWCLRCQWTCLVFWWLFWKATFSTHLKIVGETFRESIDRN